MSDSDTSSNILRYDLVLQQVQYFNGSDYYPILTTSGVSTLNTLTGAVVLAAGSGITLTPSGNTITVASTGTSGITQLTGDVTAGPGSGSRAATLITVNSNVGSFTNANITVNAKGLITAAANGSGGGGTPAGSNGDIQYNSSGAFGAVPAGGFIVANTGTPTIALTGTGPEMDLNYDGGVGTVAFNNAANTIAYADFDCDTLGNFRIQSLANGGTIEFDVFGPAEHQTNMNNDGLWSMQGLSDTPPEVQPSALLTLSDDSRGFLPPRLDTTDKLAIASPAEGLIVYDITLHKLCVFTGSVWETITSA